MQGPKGKVQPLRRRSDAAERGRVVDLRAWKAKRQQRQQQRRPYRRKWSWSGLYWVTVVVSALAAIAGVASCVPSSAQIQSIVLTWFLATVGAAGSLILYIVRHRFAMRLLSINVICMALSFMAAVVRVVLLGH